MAKKKVLNVGKVMVIVGAIIIMILVALWCGSLLKLTHEQKKPDASPVSMQSTMSVNVIVPPVTTTTTVAVAEPPQTTLFEEIPTESTTTTTTVQNNGSFREYLIRLANPELNIYSEPSYNSSVSGIITDRGSYTITKETVDDDGNKWGYIDSETTFGWINLMDARKTDPSEVGGAKQTTTTNTNTNTTTTTMADENNNTYDYDYNYGYDYDDYYIGVDADGDGWDDGWNPEAWCIICGYDSYWNDAYDCYYCSQGHAWNY